MSEPVPLPAVRHGRRPLVPAMNGAPQPLRAGRWCFRDAAGLALTKEALRVLAFAELEATLLGHGMLSTQHVLVSLLESDDGLTVTAVSRAGVPLPRVRAALTASDASTSTANGLVLGADTAAMLATAGRLATDRGDACIVARDLLHAVLTTSGTATRRLAEIGVDPEDVRDHAVRILAGSDS
ncbi:MAG: Clp protease N-terminal domain-containing protein [Egibacteraceae bacterium]